MSVRSERRPPRKARRSPLWSAALKVLATLLVLLLGVAIGRALEDGPAPGGTRTNIRTLDPRPLPPASQTVTVTVTTE